MWLRKQTSKAWTLENSIGGSRAEPVAYGS